jgi:hypothetical protein
VTAAGDSITLGKLALSRVFRLLVDLDERIPVDSEGRRCETQPIKY